jgi:hypothetical protein
MVEEGEKGGGDDEAEVDDGGRGGGGEGEGVIMKGRSKGNKLMMEMNASNKVLFWFCRRV